MTTHPAAKIGLLGIGKIGLPIAGNLLANNTQVIGYRRTHSDEFVKLGGQAANSCAEVVENAQVVLECLPSEEALVATFEGHNGVIERLRPGHIIVTLGTYPINVKQRLADLTSAKGAVLLDGEISGTPAVVAQRRSVVFLSGEEAACRECEPVIRGFTDNYFYLGEFGNASKMKLIANHLVAVNNLAAAEAMLLGVRAGLDPNVIVQVISQSVGGSAMFSIRAPLMAERRFLPAPGPVDTLKKYLSLIETLAETTATATPLMDRACEYYRKALDEGRGEEDIAVMFEILERSERAPVKTKA